MARRSGYNSFRGIDENGETCDFFVSIELLRHLERFGPLVQFYDAFLLPVAACEPVRVFRGLKREDHQDSLCYVSKPAKKYRGEKVWVPPPRKRVFLMFVRDDKTVLDWEWRVEVEYNGKSGYPLNWSVDFEKEIWP
ncbi:MAG: hypothetical protein WD065_19655 [Planctomycetaceae bacterium]